MASSMYASHAAGSEETSERTPGILAALQSQRLPTITAPAPTIGMHCDSVRRLIFPLPTTTIGLGPR